MLKWWFYNRDIIYEIVVNSVFYIALTAFIIIILRVTNIITSEQITLKIFGIILYVIVVLFIFVFVSGMLKLYFDLYEDKYLLRFESTDLKSIRLKKLKKIKRMNFWRF